MKPSNNLKNKTTPDTYWRVYLVCKKVQAHNFFRTTTDIKPGPDAFDKSRFIITFLIILRVTEICSFRVVLEGKTGKEIPESSRLESLEKFSANNFALSDAEDNTFGLLNRGSIADLPLSRALLVLSHFIFFEKVGLYLRHRIYFATTSLQNMSPINKFLT